MEIATINENTPFRLIVRKGLKNELSGCILSEGELGYTTDTKRLYVGDGYTMGGNIINNIVLSGSKFSDAEIGDIVYNDSIIEVYVGNGNWRTYLVKQTE